MTKINFTKEHYNKLCLGLLKLILNNITIPTKLGVQLNVVELLHTTTINTLNTIRVGLTNQIKALEDKDEWVADDSMQDKLDKLKETKETINLIIGYKRYLLEKEEIAKKKSELNSKLTELKEAQKTPEDKIKEIEAELSNLSTSEF